MKDQWDQRSELSLKGVTVAPGLALPVVGRVSSLYKRGHEELSRAKGQKASGTERGDGQINLVTQLAARTSALLQEVCNMSNYTSGSKK